MQNNTQFTEVDLLKEIPSFEELQALAQLAEVDIRGLVNRKSQVFKKMQKDIDQMNSQQVADLIRENPRILIRPIVSDGIKLISGFKEEDYKQFLGLS